MDHFTKEDKEDIDGQLVHDKVLSITNHQKNANQGHNKLLHHTC